MNEEIFNYEQQLEILKILKGVFLYTLNSNDVLLNEKLILRLLIKSCNNIVLVIKDKNKRDYPI